MSLNGGPHEYTRNRVALSYIGSHVVFDLLSAGHNVFVIDRDRKACEYLKKKLSRRRKLKVYCGDIEDNIFTENILSNHNIDAVVHLAALISVRESVANPVEYFHNNTGKTIKLLSLIEKYKVPRFVFLAQQQFTAMSN